MTKPTRPDVSDPELRSALDGVGEHIENYTTNLDGISQNIKAIEKYLSDSGIRLTAAASIRCWVGREEDGGVFEEAECLQWAPEDEYPFNENESQRWRIMYRRSRRDGYMESFETPVFKDEFETLERKPVIETSVAVRLRAHRAVPALLINVAKLVEVRRVSAPVTDDDLPL